MLHPDHSSIDLLVKALYASISGPAGERDWARLRSLFYPNARLAPTKFENDVAALRFLDIEQFITQAGAHFREHGFYESEVGRRVDSFGHLAHIFSRYESRRTPDGEPFARGLNSIQLFTDGVRWSIISLMWDEEQPSSAMGTTDG